jgi:hypothetical protein
VRGVVNDPTNPALAGRGRLSTYRRFAAAAGARPATAQESRRAWLLFALLGLVSLAPSTGYAQSLKMSLDAALSRPAPAQAPPEAVRTLAFARDAAVTAREQEAIIAHLSQQPGGAAMTPAIRSGKLMRSFDGLLQRYGYSSRNLGDVLAAYLVICWEIVNETDSNQQPAGQRAVRRQLAGALASVPTIARMSDAQKQSQAERTAYLTMIAGSAYQALKHGSEPARLEDLQRNVRKDLLRSGIDLKRLVLTDGGLVKR